MKSVFVNIKNEEEFNTGKVLCCSIESNALSEDTIFRIFHKHSENVSLILVIHSKANAY